MREPLESRIRKVFLDEYREPTSDLRSALRFRPRPRPRKLVQRALVFAVVGAVVVATVSLPRLAGRAPSSGRASSGFIPDFGYQLVGSKSGGAGRTYLGTVPAGYAYGLFLSNTCGAHVTPFRLSGGDGPAGAGWLVAVQAGHAAPVMAVPASSGRHRCQASGGGSRIAQTAPGRMRVYVLAARGVRWKAELEVARRPGALPTPPAMLGGCPSADVGWGSALGRQGGSATEYTLYPSGQGNGGAAKPCQLAAEVRLGLYAARTLRPLAVDGNLQPHRLSGTLSSATNEPSLTWRWTNWCGPRAAVQAVLQLASGALLLDSNAPIPLPACRDRHAPSVLTVRASG
ncbi:MAG: hypothetical protein M0T72_05830 [Candidatus Dormibacteraeota bacterium]|nr:hypothetical protein [Candidatus Dormibacteraeota bacterium]